MRITFLFITLLWSCSLWPPSAHAKGDDSTRPGVMESPRQRIIVLTDVENEPDDTQSLIRLLLYSNDLDIKGIIATTSTHMRNRVAPETIFRLIEAYGKVHANLLKHDTGYPSPEYLKSVVKAGLPRYGMNGVGQGKDSEGSEWIIRELKQRDERPLWITAWGGTNVLAQALYNMQKTMPEEEVSRLIRKLRVYAISDQDDTGWHIRKDFPDLFYIVSTGPYEDATWIGMSSTDSLANNKVVSERWLAENIQQGHGPLGAYYPDVAYSMEGDTPSFLGLVQNGLNNMEHPNWGGWGGRYEYYLPEYDGTKQGPFGVLYKPETHAIWSHAEDAYIQYWSGGGEKTAIGEYPKIVKSQRATLWRWREEYQNDFAARMDWCIKPYEKANHAPVPVVKMYTRVPDRADDTPQPELIPDFTVKSGQLFTLDATGTTDPDGDNLSYFWFNYPEAGTYPTFIPVGDNPVIQHVRYQAPQVEKETFLHFILKVTDKGTPRLTAYNRIIVRVIP